MVAHIESLGFFHANLGVKNTVIGGVVGFERSAGGRLFVTHFFESSNHGKGFLGVEEETAGFSFGGGGSNSADCFTKDMYGTALRAK